MNLRHFASEGCVALLAAWQAAHGQAQPPAPLTLAQVSNIARAKNSALDTAALSLAKRYNTHYVAESERVGSNLEFNYRHAGTTRLDNLDALRDYRKRFLDSMAADQVCLGIHRLTYATAAEVAP